MLKFIFCLLLLANAGLFAFQQGYLERIVPSGREPERSRQQLNADKIHLLPASDTARAAASSSPATAALKMSEAAACIEIGNFNADETKRFSAQLAPLSLGERLSQRTVHEVATHMVYIPPQTDREAAEKKAGELRRRGISDFYIIQDNSSMRWGISLGVFKLEEAARAHLANLMQKGVRTARIGQRTVSWNAAAFQFRQLTASEQNALESIKAEFPKQEIRACQKAE